eukprot:GGOE01004168.1.p1 GENE.GGOE01004168.1~~GGOE01004168.1.p1  ORF type:complete len:356 (-),score=53.03 GGOE01004168.1:191-1168(-)
MMKRRRLWPHGPLYWCGRRFRWPTWEAVEAPRAIPLLAEVPKAILSEAEVETAASQPSSPSAVSTPPLASKPDPRAGAVPGAVEAASSTAIPMDPPAPEQPRAPDAQLPGPNPAGLAQENETLRQEVRVLRQQLAGFLQHAAQCYSAVDWACLEARCGDEGVAPPYLHQPSSATPTPSVSCLSDATLMPPPPARKARPAPASSHSASSGLDTTATPPPAATARLEPDHQAALQWDSDSETERLSQDVPVSQLRPQPYYYGTRFPRSARPHPVAPPTPATQRQSRPEPMPDTAKKVRIADQLVETREFRLESPPERVRKRARTLEG